MLQIKNIKPNSLTNTPLILSEESKGIFSFEIEGNENVDSYNLVFTNFNFNIDQDFSSIILNSDYSDKLKEDYPDINYTEPIKRIGPPDLPAFPESNIRLAFNYSFSIKANTNMKLNNCKINYSFSIPYKIYCTYNGQEGGYNHYRERVILSSQSIEEQENFLTFSDSFYINSDFGQESFDFSNTYIFDLTQNINQYKQDESDIIYAVVSDYVSESNPIENFLKAGYYFPKFSFSFDNENFLPVIKEVAYPQKLGDGNKFGVLIYTLKPTLTIDSVAANEIFIKETDKFYKTSFGKNNIFSFDVEINDYLKKAENFYIDLKKENVEKINFINKKTGFYLGTTLAENNLLPGDYYESQTHQSYLLQVNPGEKYSITTLSNIFYHTIPLINFYNDIVPNNSSYIESIFSSGPDEETISFTVPFNAVLIAINNTSDTNNIIFSKNNQISSLISYNILSLPIVSDIILSRMFHLSNNYDYTLNFKYNEENQYPMLWYQVKIFNIYEEKESLIFDTGQIFTSQNNIIIEPIHLLPAEKYYYEIQICNTQNLVSQIYTNKESPLTTLSQEKQINFTKKEINNYLSESFITLELKDFGIGNGLYPSQTLYPSSSLYPEIEFSSINYDTIKILREDILSKQSIWIGEYNYKENLKIIDYGVKANIPYNYWGYAKILDENGIELRNVIYGIKLNNKPIIAEWDRWTLITANKTDDEKIFHVDKVFTFEMNLSSGSMTNGTNINISKNFTEYPVVQKDNSNFYSGGLTALMGVRKWGSTAEDFEQTPRMLEDLKALSTNYQPKFLKDRSGHLWQVEINGPINVANTDNLATIDLKTMTVPWVQIGEADDISLIYIGNEEKEKLYC